MLAFSLVLHSVCGLTSSPCLALSFSIAHALLVSLFGRCAVQMVQRRMWLSQTPLRQFGGALKPDIIRKIEKKDVPWERYYDLSPEVRLVSFPSLCLQPHCAARWQC